MNIERNGKTMNKSFQRKFVTLTLLCGGFIISPAYSQDKPASTELQIWNSESYKKQFALSYIAETDIEPRVTTAERETMLKVMDLIAAEKSQEAIDLLTKNNGPAISAVFDFTLANINFQQEKLDEAAAQYLAAVDKYPKFRRAWKNLAMIYVRQSNFDEAVKALTKVIETGDHGSLMYGLLGYAYAGLGNDISAESAYRMAVLLDPSTLDWKMGLARSFFKQQRYQEAQNLCQQLSKDKPDNAELWLLQANASLGLDQPLKAAEIYELLDVMGKATPDSLNMLGDIYVNQELNAPAVRAYIKAMETSNDFSPQRPLRSAKVLAARGDRENAATILTQVEKTFAEKLNDSDKKELLRIKARLAVAAGATGQEVSILEEIIALDPLDGDAIILLGQNAASNKDNEKAIFYYERAANIPAFEADAKIKHAQLLVSSGKYSEALPLLRRAQQLKPREKVQEYLDQVEKIANKGTN